MFEVFLPIDFPSLAGLLQLRLLILNRYKGMKLAMVEVYITEDYQCYYIDK